ncbi:hypothetical protein H6F89_33270 [Cyanobacteria bacterium FACHB-63]|nr:hypothetical protein [Cyanobacteria bacterium FACHB-63]
MLTKFAPITIALIFQLFAPFNNVYPVVDPELVESVQEVVEMVVEVEEKKRDRACTRSSIPPLCQNQPRSDHPREIDRPARVSQFRRDFLTPLSYLNVAPQD